MIAFSIGTGLLLTAFISLIKRATEENYMSRGFTDTLRGMAILMILFHHAETNLYNELPSVWTIFVPLGAFGTAIFFFLSGYGNYFSLRKTPESRGGTG